ncbi:alpha/beta fold hydrolase [Corynebacterium testudinoris]|uniref:Putative hydrolase or acyltransferase of alpha/beta superfamily n=1 Tax=Corynebacterium testudinoris TaxID=136857 RepID=A0A0G3H6M3_9CORY|nr:alpha/beta fold hydrolase [Corynebacterium testudinoris]AKK07493.1 putative hydrolase or acyltransferase of alpha/beta superfamily [Corynebacterium testudinoris]
MVVPFVWTFTIDVHATTILRRLEDPVSTTNTVANARMVGMDGTDGEHTVVFIHGLGDSPDAWNYQVSHLPSGFTGMAIGIPGLRAGEEPSGEFSLAAAAAGIVAELDHRGVDKLHLCGLSLGAMITLQIAIDYPERVRSLTLAAGQVKPPRVLMRIQTTVMRLVPARLLARSGVRKPQLLSVLRGVAEADFSTHLADVTAPTLVLCGSKDRANLPAARALAAGIPDADLNFIGGAGHQANTQKPELFTAALNGFLRSQNR